MPDFDDRNYESIIPTAYVTAYPRIFTGTPYWKEIFDQLELLLDEEGIPKIAEDSKIIRLAPELESRYLLINKLLEQSGVKQVLELAAGLSPRGLIMTADSSVKYTELDLPSMAHMKKKILAKVKEIPSNLHIVAGNALRLSDLEKATSDFDKSQPVAVINEGLLRYLNFDEKAQVAKNIRHILKQFGGTWITCDTTPKKFLAVQDKTTSPGFNKKFITKTGKNFYNNMFEDEHHVKQFFEDLGFSIQSHSFNEVIDELTSPDKLKLNRAETEELLKSGTVVVMNLRRD